MIDETVETPQDEMPATPADAPVDLTAGAVEALNRALAPKVEAEPAPAEVPAPVEAEATEAAPAPEKDADVEIAELGLKERSAVRFKELHSYKAAMKEAGISDVAELPRMIERARFADELEGAIQQTGATPEQYGQAIRYLALANSGPEGMAQAYEIMQGELAAMAKALGREAPGIHDPLSEHDDLRDEVESGDLTRKRALEIVQQRASTNLNQARSDQTRQAGEQKQTFDTAISDLNALGAQLKAADPLYAAKLAALQPAIGLIREHYPPAEWTARVQAAYQQVQVAAPQTRQPLPPPGPVRSVTPAGVALAAEPKNAMDALEIGLRQAELHR